jgi:hypothetical protein
MGVPPGRWEEGRKLEPGAGHADARRPRVAGRGVTTPGPLSVPPAAGTPPGFSLLELLCTDCLEPRRRGEGTLLSLQPRPPGAPARRRVCSSGALCCRPRVGAGRTRIALHRCGFPGCPSPEPLAAGHLHALPLLSCGHRHSPGGSEVTSETGMLPGQEPGAPPSGLRRSRT